ncbi:hypothetical protein CEUSTIGMA_g1266.t1 [Chlamydomonas eustigma]|uniref:Glutamine amidotransferase type-2 domain-containing protein n=1 Tax=Chlamydomonas eustigma TaxID=1157962 RepID=A0A250WSL0_9CHLO|nr:hypothetical protein CEUSTIGMA_g1266.t1 [Chlamydomonas eustigma]|eukprot:GAX73815.1 hypothetical protein CEUSTIGMA_g1266.t1 [Chlamydomonas eustigma]
MPSTRMLAIFGAETALPPAGISSPSANRCDVEEDMAKCQALLNTSFESLKSSADLMYPGKGCGFGFTRSPYCSYAHKDGVHVMFSGEVSQWPGIDVIEAAHDAFMCNTDLAEADDAHWLLDFYSSFSNTELAQDENTILQEALNCLASIRGSFAFVIYDSLSHRVLASRDADGVQPLHWGATSDGQLLFGSHLEDLKDCNPTATIFPPGTLFSSVHAAVAYNPGPEGWVIAGQEYPGELISFMKADEEHWKSVKAIPRITSKGCVSGAVYKVSSQPDFIHLMTKSSS